MTDILPVGQSINAKTNVNHNNIRPDQQSPQSQNDFNIVDLAKVLKPNNKDEYGDNSFLENQRQKLTEKFFFNLIKEPGLAAGSLKNIFNSYLIMALSGENKITNSDELSAFVNSLTLDYSQMLGELFTQSEGISMFKGQFFDVLRLLYSSSNDTSFKDSIIKLLKGISVKTSNQDTLNSLNENIKSLMGFLPEKSMHYGNLSNISNIISFLKSNSQTTNSNNGNKNQNLLANNFLMQKASYSIKQLVETLSLNSEDYSQEKISSMLKQLNLENKNWLDSFDIVKSALTQVISNIEKSPFNNTQTEAFAALSLYNLSYLNSTPENINDLFLNVLVKLGDNKELAGMLSQGFKELNEKIINKNISDDKSSDLIKSISKFVASFYKNGKNNTIANTEINNILRSLIAAPNSFTPLLHFMLPMKYNTAQGFGELWVDPYEIAKNKKGEIADERAVHMFFVADIMDIGYFEVDIMLFQNKLNVNLLCPPDHIESFKAMRDKMSKAIATTTNYKFESLSVDSLVKKRNLPQVFPKLTEKRDGFSAKI